MVIIKNHIRSGDNLSSNWHNLSFTTRHIYILKEICGENNIYRFLFLYAKIRSSLNKTKTAMLRQGVLTNKLNHICYHDRQARERDRHIIPVYVSI